MPPEPADVMAAIPAAVSASVVLVTTSTLYGSAAAALIFADALAGTTRPRLNRARPSVLLHIQTLLEMCDPRAARASPLATAPERPSLTPASSSGRRPLLRNRTQFLSGTRLNLACEPPVRQLDCMS